jgi:chorismate mutase
MSGDDTTLEDLRRRLNEIDRRLLAAVAERKEVSREVARVKRATGRATRDYEREREVILGVRAAAQELGVSPPRNRRASPPVAQARAGAYS